MSSLNERLARARQQLATHAGAPSWDELTVAEQKQAIQEAAAYLRAAAAAGIAVAAIDPGEMSAPARVTASVRGVDGRPLSRDDYAAHLQARAELGRGEQRRPLLGDEEAQAVAALLDELAGVYRGEDLGRLARELAVILYDRLGI